MRSSWTLTEAAKLLRAPQHTLIHLCEKNVVVPDIEQARGRGSSRKFSKRNLFDFALALELRRLEVPVSYVQAVLRVVRAFETEARTMLSDFTVPDSLFGPTAPRLILTIVDGERLYFTLGAKKQPRIFGGVNIRHPRLRGRSRQHHGSGRLQANDLQDELNAARIRTDVDLSKIAQELSVVLTHI
jgi:DNA-binding transcriptional MerR regulator